MTTMQAKPPAPVEPPPPAAVAAAAAAPAPAAVESPVAALAEQSPATRKFTVAEYYRMAEVGILGPEERVQLIEGEIILMPPMGPGHAGKITLANHRLGLLAADQFLVRIQIPLHLDDGSEPEPDIALVRPRADYYATSHPTPADTLLVLEVSDSALEYDRRHKAHIYGRAGIAQTLVLNLPEDCIENFTEPGPQGYARHTIHRRGDKIRLVALPDLELTVADLLPPLPAVAAGDAAENGNG